MFVSFVGWCPFCLRLLSFLMKLRQIYKDHIPLFVSVGAFILIFALPSMFIGFYGDHGFRHPHSRSLAPNYDVRAISDFFNDNYRYLFVHLVSESDLAIHINRMFWFITSGVAVYAVCYVFWESQLAGLLAMTTYLSYPVLSSQRLWSVGFLYSIAVFFACLSLIFELKMLKDGFSLRRRVCAFLFYFFSIYTIEFFIWMPVITVFVAFYRFVKGKDQRIDLQNVLSFVMLYVPVTTWLYLWETRAGRKAVAGLIPDPFTLDLKHLAQDFGIPMYQLISGNNGKGFASFLIEVATLVPDIGNIREVSLSLLWAAVVCCSMWYVFRTRELKSPGLPLYVLFSIVWIGLSAVVVALGGMKGGSNGYIADRVNGGLSSGAAFMFSGLFMLGFLGRDRTRTLCSFVLLTSLLFLFMFSSLLQLRDWRYLGEEEARIRDILTSSGLIGEVRSSNPILLSGVPHVLSSFPHKSNPNFSGDHVYSNYKFTPLSLHKRWPDAVALSRRLDAALFRIDAFHRVRCLSDMILLEKPAGMGDRNLQFPRTPDKHDEVRVIHGAIYVVKEREGKFTAEKVDASNCSTVIPDQFRTF